MPKQSSTIVDDLDTLRETLDGLIEYGTSPARETVWSGRWDVPSTFRERTSGPPRWSTSVTDPLYIARWALQRVEDQLALKAHPDLYQIAVAALERATTTAEQVVKSAKEKANLIKRQARLDAKDEYEEIVRRAKEVAADIEVSVDRLVEERMDQMYGRAATIRRRRPLALHGKKLILVDED